MWLIEQGNRLTTWTTKGNSTVSLGFLSISKQKIPCRILQGGLKPFYWHLDVWVKSLLSVIIPAVESWLRSCVGPSPQRMPRHYHHLLAALTHHYCHWFAQAKDLSFKKTGWKIKGRRVHKGFLDSTVHLVINILCIYFYSFSLASLGLCFILNPLFCESHQIRNTFIYEKNLLQLIQKETITETPAYYIWSLFKKQTKTMQDTEKYGQVSLRSCLEMCCSWSHL